jgi:hypothetical protein
MKSDNTIQLLHKAAVIVETADRFMSHRRQPLLTLARLLLLNHWHVLTIVSAIFVGVRLFPAERTRVAMASLFSSRKLRFALDLMTLLSSIYLVFSNTHSFTFWILLAASTISFQAAIRSV